MSQAITGMFASKAQAADAAGKLKSAGYFSGLISVISPDDFSAADLAAPGAVEKDRVLAAIMAAYVLKVHAKVYAAHVRAGRSLTVIRALLSSFWTLPVLLRSRRPDTGSVAALSDKAAPFSSTFKLPLLLESRYLPRAKRG